MDMAYGRYIVPLFLVFFCCANAANRYKMCAYPNYNFDLCKTLEVGDSTLSCVMAVDSVDCALKIANGTVDFGVFRPEEAVMITNYATTDPQFSQNISVIGEIRYKKYADERYSFRQVVVVPQNFSGNYKGKNYCHPGFQTPTHTDRVLKHFERKVMNMECKKTVSAAEQEITELSYFFKSACRPGPWAENAHLDKTLKGSYPNLCELCNADSCSYSDDGIHGDDVEEQVLKCLTERGGDIAYVTHAAVRRYFQTVSNSSSSPNLQDYKLMCPDGSEQPLLSNEPCAWVYQPWTLILTRRDGAETSQTDIIGWLTQPGGGIWKKAFSKIIIDNFKVALNVSGPKPLDEYIRRGCDDDPDGASCREDVKWCTVSLAEYKKCKWLKSAAAAHGMVPKLRCVSSHNLWNCLANIGNNKADVIGVNTEYGYIARKIFNLTAVVYEDSEHLANYRIIAVKKAERADINSFADLVGKKACFPEYRGLGWNAFVKTAKDLNLLKKRTCPQSFFSASCTPGANDKNHALPTENVPPSLTQLCSTADNQDDNDPLSKIIGNLAAIQCLAKGNGDVAFVDYNNLISSDSNQLDQIIDPKTLQVICRNGSLSKTPGILVDDDCALSSGIRGEIMSRVNNSGVVTRDTSELFMKMNDWFGAIIYRYQGVFKMFEEFDGQKDILFQDGTVSIVESGNVNYPMISNYNELLAAQFDCSRGDVIKASLLVLLVGIFLIL